MNGYRRCGIYRQWNITQSWKEWNNSICSNMNGPRGFHTKWNKPDKDKYHMILYKCGILKIQMNLFTKQKETHRHRKQTYDYQRRKGRG